MDLPDGEPAFGPWRVAALDELLDVVNAAAGPAASRSGRPLVLAVDGRGAGGKTTLAEQLVGHVPASALVSTDDVAWGHGFFSWDGLLAEGVLEPLRSGGAVDYRPPGWDGAGRDGSLVVPAGLEVLVVEGVGAGRRSLAALLDAVVWVQSDSIEAERRGIARDVASGVNGDTTQTVAFWHEWMAEELPFQAAERPWERACAVVAGTPQPPPPPGHVLLADPSPAAVSRGRRPRG